MRTECLFGTSVVAGPLTCAGEWVDWDVKRYAQNQTILDAEDRTYLHFVVVEDLVEGGGPQCQSLIDSIIHAYIV